ncbi:hypothetical protein [Mesorhizobium sp. CN2-181]|uniref:hypothetical protein n=1 Tax=Mesorhizobium yinganensis TaxID=3157707 RepID=UPI0032B78A82
MAELSPIDAVVMPRKPDRIRALDAAAQAAHADLESVRARHREASRQLSGQMAGQAPTITRTEVDEIGREIAVFEAKHAEAVAAALDAKVAFQAEVDAALDEPLKWLAGELSRILDQLDDLAGKGACLHSNCVIVGVEAPNTMAGLSRHFIERCVIPGRQILGMVKDRPARRGILPK